jgi:hypothetical protein
LGGAVSLLATTFEAVFFGSSFLALFGLLAVDCVFLGSVFGGAEKETFFFGSSDVFESFGLVSSCFTSFLVLEVSFFGNDPSDLFLPSPGVRGFLLEFFAAKLGVDRDVLLL